MMTCNARVSILIISYNEKEYLPQAVESCLSQNYSNKEIIIGDDGSDDGSIDYIKSIYGNGIHHFVMLREPDEIIPSIRVSNVIKRGLDMAEGEYFAILSGDDYYLDDNTLSDAVEFLDSHRDYIAYVNGFRRVDNAGNVIDESIPEKTDSIIYWSGYYTHISCFVFRKLRSFDLLDRMCDDTGLQYILADGKWGFGNKAALAYRQRDTSIQHKADPLELAILEAMIMQDIMNCPNKKLHYATLSRFFKPIEYIARHASELDNPKYAKYLTNCAMYDNNIILAAKAKEIPYLSMWLCNKVFSVIRIITSAVRIQQLL